MTNKASLSAQDKNALMNSERAFLTRLLGAARQGDWPALRSEVETYCKSHGLTSPIEVLLQCKDGHKRTVLHFACQSENDQYYNNQGDDGRSRDIVADLLEASWWKEAGKGGMDALQTWIRLKDKDGLTPIMLAAQVGNPHLAEDRVRALLTAADSQLSAPPPSSLATNATTTNTTNTDSPNANNETTTTTNKNTDKPLGKLTLARSHAGATALHYAAGARGSSAIIHLLVQHGKPALQAFSKQGGAPLHWACAARPLASNSSGADTIQALLECGANINAHCSGSSDKNGTSMVPPPLFIALATSHEDYALVLLQVATRSSLDLTESLRYILEPGHCTVWHMAADLNMGRTLGLLMQEPYIGITREMIMLPNSQEMTPLEVAAYEEHVDCVRLILSFVKGDDSVSEDEAREYMRACNNGEEVPTYTIDSKSSAANKPAETDTSPSSTSTDNTTAKAADGTENGASSNGNGNGPGPSPAQSNFTNTAKSSDAEETDIQRIERQAKDAIAAIEAQAAASTPESKEKAQAAKLAGNDHFSAKAWKEALECYTKAIEADPMDATLYSNRSAGHVMLYQDEHKKEQQVQGDTHSQTLSNTSTCSLHLLSALSDALLAVHWRPNWPKAHFRVATARMHLGQYEEAAVAAWEGIQQDPETDNKDLKDILQTCVEKGRQVHQDIQKKMSDQKKLAKAQAGETNKS
jgi:ankyrin repeat protein